MATLWDRTKNFGITGLSEPVRGRFTIPDGHALLAADQIYKMLLWIEEEFQEDCKHNPDIMLPAKNGNDQKNFVTRNTSRTLSYVNQACLLEGILRKSYEKTVISLRVIDSSVMEDVDGLKKRKEEIANIKKFRDKVAAHTVYSRPDDGDNPAQELKSLIDLISTSYDASGKSDTFRLGAMSIRVGGEKPKYEPEASINEMHLLMIDHFKKWIDMIETICRKVHPLLPKTVDGIKYFVEGNPISAALSSHL